MEFLKKIFRERRGNFMIEAMVALTLITVGMLGVLSLVSRSLTLNSTVNQKFVAANLAAEGVEVVKNLIDTSLVEGEAWNGWFNGDGWYEVSYDSGTDSNQVERLSVGDSLVTSPVFFSDSDNSFNHNAGNNTVFLRGVRIQDEGSYIKVNSVVKWSFEDDENQIDVEDRFYNWR